MPDIERIKVRIGRRTYTVVRSEGVVTRIEAINAVRGVCNIDMTGRLAKSVLRLPPPSRPGDGRRISCSVS
jgi:hypothetical protein